MQRILVPVLALLALAIVCLLCVRCHGPDIQADLGERGRQGLAAAGFEQAVLEIDGRDAILIGSAATDADRGEAARIVADTWGVRSVDNRLTVAAARTDSASQPSPTAAVRFELGRSADTLFLRGVVPSAPARDRIVARAVDLWGANRVTDELTVDPALEEPAWLEGLPEALGVFDQRTEGGSLSIGGGEATIGGRVFAEAARRDLIARLRETLRGLEIKDRLELRPPSTAAELQATLDTAIRDRTVEFATNSAELTAVGRAVLDEIFELLSSQSSLRIGIDGHTDSRGSAEHNLALSRRRASSARDYLVGRGLAADRFETSGFGGDRPVADNDTPEGRRRNRRIEFEVLEEPK